MPRRHLVMIVRTVRGLVPAVFLAVVSTACVPGSSSGSPAAEGAQVTVHDRAFAPSTLSVGVGDTVTWVWGERKLHNVVGEGFRSRDRRSGTFRHTFEEAGTYPYECMLHPGMDGLVVVRSGDSSPTPAEETTGREP